MRPAWFIASAFVVCGIVGAVEHQPRVLLLVAMALVVQSLELVTP